MTSPTGGTRDSRHQFRSISLSTNGSSRATRRRRTSRSADHYSENVVGVEDASRLVECAQISRQLRFQHLVRRYLSQILYGCTSAYCTTPTCLTCNKRLNTRPFRPPTQLTARALAYFLASQDDPRRGLCPHELKVDPDSLEIEGAKGVNIRQGNNGLGQICDVFPIARPHAPKSTSKRAFSAANIDGATEERADAQRITDAVAKRHQTRKDPKSLGQNLYDTVTMIFSYSKQIPNPLTVFAALRSPSVQEQLSAENDMQNRPIATSDSKRHHGSTGVTLTGHGHAVPPAVNGNHTATEIASHNSHRNNRRLSRSHSMRITSEVLSNGQHLHKIRHLPEPAINGHPSNKLSEPSPLDGTLEEFSPEVARMRAKGRVMDLPIRLKKRTLSFNPPDEKKRNRVQTSDKEIRATLPVTSHLTCDVMDQLKEGVYHHRNDQSSDFNFVVDYDTNRRFQPAKPFVNRSMFFTLSDSETLLESFRDQPTEAYINSSLPHLDSHRLTHAFRDWNRRNGALVFDSLWMAVEALFRPPPELDTQKSPRLKPSRKDAIPLQPSRSSEISQAIPGRYLTDEEAAHIIMICIHALTSLVPNGWPHTWVQVRKFRGWGIVIPGPPPQADFTDGLVHPWLYIVDELEYEPAIRLADRLLRGIGARMCFEHVLASIRARENTYGQMEKPSTMGALAGILIKHLAEVERDAFTRKMKMKVTQNSSEDPGWTVTATFMEWLRTIIIKQWDGKAEINKWSSVGTAALLLAEMHTKMNSLNLRPQMFHIPYFNERIDIVQEPVDFLSWEERPNSFHIFQYPFLFPQEYLVGYFRTMNFTNMYKQFEKSMRTLNLENRMDYLLRRPYWEMIRSHLKITLRDYLVLEIGRQNPLKDTLDQLWGLEKRMLLKPLKVRMGMQEGEVGLDQGGVTYEFFRLVLGDAFKPDNGMFTVDPQTRMVWFQPASFEPDWKFQMLGILFSLALYNGITLPVTFPLVFYKYLLGPDHPNLDPDVSPTDSIRDGWPLLAKSFDEFLAYDDEVADFFMRDYSFSFEAFGRNIDVDMQAFVDRPWPPEKATWKEAARKDAPKNVELFNPAELTILHDIHKRRRLPNLSDPAWLHPALSADDSVPNALPVTNANREQFVKDYIEWLTHRSVSPQLHAFASGFHTCLHPTSLHLFTPTTLRALVEGNPSISISSLRQSTHYEGYSPSHPAILNFWSIVEKYGEEDKKRLLEFVTASERVPVTGYESMQFSIMRSGGDTEMLPTSSTCFGKLMLPEYAGRSKMERKLRLALRNSKGFGVV